MTPEERNVIGGIFDRLREAAYQPRDPEAERFIADRIREQPYAPYAMAQSIFVQEQALGNLSQQVEQLQAEIAQLRQQAQPQQSGGFLSGLFGGGAPARPAAMPPQQRAAFSNAPRGPMQQPGYGQGGGYAPPPQQAGGPWGQQAPGGFAPQQAAAPQRGGMGFLGTAAMTAAGVAGGLIAGNALMNAFNSNGGASGIANSLGFGGDNKSGNESSSMADSGYQDPASSEQGAYDNASYEDESGSGGGDSYDSASYDTGGDSYDSASYDTGGDGGDWS